MLVLTITKFVQIVYFGSMCIFVSDNHYKIAKEDIVCYKVLRKKNIYDSTPVSPYHQEMEWRFDEVFKAPKPKWKLEYDKYHDGWFTNDGYFYTFREYYDAWRCCEKFSWSGARCLYMIVKCTIPKGTHYYIGIQGAPEQNHRVLMELGELAYASKRLVINEIVE